MLLEVSVVQAVKAMPVHLVCRTFGSCDMSQAFSKGVEGKPEPRPSPGRGSRGDGPAPTGRPCGRRGGRAAGERKGPAGRIRPGLWA